MCFCLYFSVNRIKTETGTSILIPSNNEKSNVLRIEGSPKGVALAKAEILQMVKKLVSLFVQNVFTVFNFFVCFCCFGIVAFLVWLISHYLTPSPPRSCY